MHSNLHQAQSNDVLRSWQSQRNDVNHHTDFVLPIFVGNDDDAKDPIESMPGVFRYGSNRLMEYLEPLIERYNLSAVLLFPVVTAKRDDDNQDLNESSEISSSSSPRPGSSSSAAESSQSSDDDEVQRLTNVIPDRRISTTSNNPTTGTNNNATNSNSNPFLNQNEETENLLEADHQVDEQQLVDDNQQVGRWMPVVDSQEALARQATKPEKVIRVSKAQDIKLIKGMALQDKHNPVLRLIPRLRSKFPNLLIICDVCLCAFTSTGHCCLFEDHARAQGATGISGTSFPISNKLTCQYLAMLSVEYAQRGCDMVAPSDMMDGRILVIRDKLNESGLSHVSILSYSAKFASALYGPFRHATDNAPEFGDRRAYQLPPGSRALSLKAVSRDIDQGADFVMVKPAGLYLDIVRDIKNNHPEVPIAVYHVSGEYSMLKIATQAGLVDLKRAVNETLTAFRRAGATIIITYFAADILQNLY